MALCEILGNKGAAARGIGSAPGASAYGASPDLSVTLGRGWKHARAQQNPDRLNYRH